MRSEHTVGGYKDPGAEPNSVELVEWVWASGVMSQGVTAWADQ